MLQNINFFSFQVFKLLMNKAAARQKGRETYLFFCRMIVGAYELRKEKSDNKRIRFGTS